MKIAFREITSGAPSILPYYNQTYFKGILHFKGIIIKVNMIIMQEKERFYSNKVENILRTKLFSNISLMKYSLKDQLIFRKLTGLATVSV